MESLPQPPPPTRFPSAPMQQQQATRGTSVGGNSTATSSSARLESFTEAVPLSLSSVAHGSIPLEDGVLDGIRQIVQHTLLSCVNYARIVHPPHLWTFRDLATSPFAWHPIQGTGGKNRKKADSDDEDETMEGQASSSSNPPLDIPYALQKWNFKHQYSRNALIYLKPALPEHLSMDEELDLLHDWSQHVGILGRISLLYLSTEPLTRGEMDGTDTDDMPPCMLYKVMVEYRTLPPTGNPQAIQAEELSMLSFGGSVDDCIKFGALASLYDVDAKYVLEIYSTRGKKYKFDLMDATLSNGMIPRLPSSRDGDPFVKCLCVTVTDHDYVTTNTSTTTTNHSGGTDTAAGASAATSATSDQKKYAVARMHLLLEGKPRKGQDFSELPPFNYFTSNIMASYLCLNPHVDKDTVITAMPCGHSLLLDAYAHAGRLYVNGNYVATWGHDVRMGNSVHEALFGMDLHSIPMWHNRIVDFEAVYLAYGQLWQEILIDAKLQHLNLANKLLFRLMKGRDPDEDDDEYDDDANVNASSDVNQDCLESYVLASTKYDPVGIAAKALATRFAMEFGHEAFPCLEHEVEWVKSVLPDRSPIIVPQRLLNVLRRGGYFDVQRTSDDLWFLVTRAPKDGKEKGLVLDALRLLEDSGCDDLALAQFGFVSSPPVTDVLRQKLVCRYSEGFQQYCIHEKFLQVPVEHLLKEAGVDKCPIDNVQAYVLGLHIAREHPDGRVLTQYLLRALQSSRVTLEISS